MVTFFNLKNKMLELTGRMGYKINMAKYYDAELECILPTEDHISVKWILGHEPTFLSLPRHSGKWRYSKWFGGYCKNKISIDRSEDLFWNVITLIHYMSTRWSDWSGYQSKFAFELIKEDNVTFTVFSYWELELKVNTDTYWIKFKPPTSRKSARISIWTHMECQSSYMTDLMPKMPHIPFAVKSWMEQDQVEVEEFDCVELIDDDVQQNTCTTMIVYPNWWDIVWTIIGNCCFPRTIRHQ